MVCFGSVIADLMNRLDNWYRISSYLVISADEGGSYKDTLQICDLGRVFFRTDPDDQDV